MPTAEEMLEIMQRAKKKPESATSETPSFANAGKSVTSVDVLVEDATITELRRISVLLTHLKAIFLGNSLGADHTNADLWKI